MYLFSSFTDSFKKHAPTEKQKKVVSTSIEPPLPTVELPGHTVEVVQKPVKTSIFTNIGEDLAPNSAAVLDTIRKQIDSLNKNKDHHYRLAQEIVDKMNKDHEELNKHNAEIDSSEKLIQSLLVIVNGGAR